jgi:hypothetical protein
MERILAVSLLFCFVFVGLAQSQQTKPKRTISQKAKATKPKTPKAEENKPVYGPPPKPKNEITPEKEKEAKAFAELFLKRLRETRDLKPLIDEMFFSGFKQMAERNAFWWGSLPLPYDTGEYLTADERLKLFCDGFMAGYLMSLYIYSKMPASEIGSNENEDFDKLYPPAIAQYFKSRKKTEDTTNRKEFISFLMADTVQALKLFREETIKNPPEETEQFKANLRNFATHLEDPSNDWGQLFARILDKEMFGLPIGTKIIRMEIPFHSGLVMAKEKGQLKVVTVLGWIPPD